MTNQSFHGEIAQIRPSGEPDNRMPRERLRRANTSDDAEIKDSRRPELSTVIHWIVGVAEIDRFARLRESVGYEPANALITECSARVRKNLPGCKIGRVGRATVEFAFASDEHDDIRSRLQALADEIERPFWFGDIEFDLTVTIGAVDIGQREIDDRLLDAAAAAVRTAQDSHEKVCIGEAPGAQGAALDDLSLLRDLRQALKADSLDLYYQPKLRSRTETITSAEALLRWTHPAIGPVRIDKLIELAEATGAIRELTFWVVERALRDQQALALEGQQLTIFVNVSGMLLADVGFADWALDHLNAKPGAIGFEITETAVIAEPTTAIQNLQRFVAAGIRIAIDDYGSGLSSLAYLKQLPAHELKIDRLFVKGLTETQRDPLLVRSSIDLAHALEMEVTAEGVDDQMSLSLLRVMGCDMVQGFLISRPLPLNEFKSFLQEARHRIALDATADALAQWSVAARMAE